MIIVGELINASRKSIKEAIEAQDVKTLRAIAKDQESAGAHYIDVNAGVFEKGEADHLKWLVEIVQDVVDVPCCIDSPNPAALEAALSVHQGTPMINSITLEKDRCDKLLPIIAGTDFKVVALCMSDKGMPRTAEERLSVAEGLVDILLKNNIKVQNIFVDPLVQPVATDQSFGREFLEAIEAIMKRFEGIHTICGLSNISFGLPERRFLNQTFMVMAITKGLDAAIVDPLDKRMMGNIVSAEALAGRDRFCMNYLKAYRGHQLDF
ncbi:MAG: methyltetrahydrofolate cobalamin methyltransferase [Deltaproteobacteria bacterium]|nr:methyltetrahydrofolate cobalamin methyltransferase [Deltaproteobacteria bacterium]MBW2138249.1 methyltetrahydrofolate cobalamin methyltransferase [Deltaproteobacteria bacterium]